MTKSHNTIQYVLFDLDDTLYPGDIGLTDILSRRISEYMETRLGIEPGRIKELRAYYWDRYGTTGQGLAIHHDVDLEDYFSFVHDIPVEEFLSTDQRLDRMLASLAAKKVILTNATREHARRVLRALGIEGHFQRIIDIRDLDYVPKPDVRTYEKVLRLLDTRPEECLLVEDRPRNLAAAKQLGLTTVLVGNEGSAGAADFVLQDITELGQLFEAIRVRREAQE